MLSAAKTRAVLVGAVVLATLGVASIGASPALALGEQCSGSGIAGQGAALQSRAQSIWAGEGEFGFNVSSDPAACNGEQGSGGTPAAVYGSTSSGQALSEWGSEDGSTFNEELQFIATDEAPAGPVTEPGTQLANIKEAAGSNLAVVPVAQTAIAIVANPPDLVAHEACTIDQITQVDLEGVFRGTTTNWRQLGTVSDQEAGGDCDQAITRVVREEGSGTTYQLKRFLYLLNSGTLPCTGKTKKTWAQLQPSTSEGAPNTVWPRKADCQGEEGPVTVVTTPGGPGPSNLASFVAENTGTIGYVGLPEAETVAPNVVVEVFNGIDFAAPGGDESKEEGEKAANCAFTKYTLPAKWESGENVDWSQVYGVNPEIGGEDERAYPICTLTWAVTATESSVFGEEAATTVHDYLDYTIAKSGGQAGLPVNWYSELPTAIAEAAEAAVGKIGSPPPLATTLCGVAPENEEGVLICPAGERYSGPVNGALPAESTTTFESTKGPAGAVTCDSASLSGSFTEGGVSLGGEEGVQLSFGNGEGSHCPSTIEALEGVDTEVSLYNPPYDASKFVYLAALAPHASFVLAKDKGTPPALRLQPKEIELQCDYDPSFLGGQIVNGSPTTLLLSATWQLDPEGPENCPGALSQVTSLDLSRPGEESDIYVAGG